MLNRLLEALRRLPGQVQEAGLVSLRDLLCFGGLAGVGYGLALVYEPAAWCVVGAALFWLSLRRPDGSA